MTEERSRRAAPWRPDLLIALVTLAACAAPPGARTESREWTGIIRLGGSAVGTQRDRIAVRPDGAIVTRSEVGITLERTGRRIEMNVVSTSEESAGGDLRRMSTELRLSGQTQRTEAIARGGQLHVRSWSGGPTAAPARVLPLTARLIGPEGLRRRTAAELRRVGDALEASMFVADLGGVHSVRRVLRAVTDDRGRPARVVEERWRGLPIVRTLRFDGAGMLIDQREAGPFGEMTIARASRAQPAPTGELPAGMYERTLVRSNVRIPSPRAADFLRLRMTLTDDSLGWPELDGEGQRVISRDGKSVVLEIDRSSVARGVAPGAEFLASNAIIESADPEVVRLARAITGGERDPVRKALLLTEWVHRNMKFDLGVVMAPASEIARQRRGTCAGYATLLAALARASGIPSRYLVGFVYTLGIWGGHAWVEMWVGGRWLPFDAAVFGPGPADAGHIAIARDSLERGAGEASLAGLRVYGRVAIEVLAMRIAGRDVAVPPSPAALVRGDTWESPGLGLAVRLPPGARFAVTDAVWPDSTLVALDGPEGARVHLREESRYPERGDVEAATARLRARGLGAAVETRAAGRPAYRAVGKDRAGVAWIDGSEVFTLVVDGDDASAVLDRVLEGVQFRAAPRGEPPP